MNRTILVIGAGRSSTSLITYLLDNASEQDWNVRVGDMDIAFAEKKIGDNPHGKAFKFNALNDAQREREIKHSDFVISMLPARFHTIIVKDCIRFKKDIITPSYISKELNEMAEEALVADIIVLNEIGLDPGIDHMSAKLIIDEVQNEGGVVDRFESFTGGLVAPEYDNNPWNYKFTWNPRNVVLAGQGGAAQLIQNGRFKYIPYHKLFSRTKAIEIDGYGMFEGYPNRDSLKYKDFYNLGDIPTIYRGTLRRAGFCKAWDVFVQLGMTDDSFHVDECETLSYRAFTNSFLAYRPEDPVEDKLQEYLGLDDETMEKLKWLGLFSDEAIGLKNVSPAQVLQHLLEKKWSLEPDDKDMIVMWHRFNYHLNDEKINHTSTMIVKGDDQDNTAMAKTVGLPVGIACKLIMTGEIKLKGIQLPTKAEIYEPVLKELEEFGITFTEKKNLM